MKVGETMAFDEEKLPSYKVGETIRFPLHLQDASGVGFCSAMFYRLHESESEADYDYDSYISLDGNGHGLRNTVVELTGTLSHHDPGIYSCAWIQVRDVVGNLNTLRDLDPRPRFRVEETPGADLDAPEIIEIGELDR